MKKYYVKGMHCRSCELLIEERLKEKYGFNSINASVSNGTVEFPESRKEISTGELSKLFENDGYCFSDKPFKTDTNYYLLFLVALLTIFGLFRNDLTELFTKMNVDQTSSLFAFFVYGLAAGISSCMVLVGSLILSLSKKQGGFISLPMIGLLSGRMVSYFLIGGIIRLTGSLISLSGNFYLIFSIFVALIVGLLGLQMVGINFLSKLQIAPSGDFLHKIIGTDRKGIFSGFLIGISTILLPCGFTLTTAGIAATSGSFESGSLIMLSFVLGTTLPLFFIAITGKKYLTDQRVGNTVSKIAGIFIVLFAVFTIYRNIDSLNLGPLGKSQNNLNNSGNTKNPIQIIKMNASSRAYSPNYFQVKAGVPVRWEITDIGTSGCTNAVIANGLFEGSIKLTPGKTSVVEFTPKDPGRYTFSCWMGMIRGTIEVTN